MNDSATAPGSAGRVSSARTPGQQQQRQPDVPLVLLGHLVDGLEHRLPGGEQPQVVADRQVRRDDLGLRDRVQRATAVVQHQRHVGERLQARPEPAGGLADPLRDRPDLAGALGHDGDDLVGLAELDRAQDDALFLIGGHGRIVLSRPCGTPIRLWRFRCDEAVATVAGGSPASPVGRRSPPPGSAAAKGSRPRRWPKPFGRRPSAP